MDAERKRLLAIIDYVEATERDKLKAVFDYTQHKGYRFDEIDVRDLPSVTWNRVIEDDIVWLEVGRLAKRQSPVPKEPLLRLWLQISDDPALPPALKETITGKALADEGFGPSDEVPEFVSLVDQEFEEQVRNLHTDYLNSEWQPWSVEEARRRKSISLYNSLFAVRQLLDGTAETPVEFVCGIGVSTIVRDGTRLRYPLLTVPLEVSLNEKSHAIEIRPRIEVSAGIEADLLDRLELNSVDEWRKFTSSFLNSLDDDPLSPFAEETFQPILRQAVAVLDSNAVYIPDEKPENGRVIPSFQDFLQVSDAFVFYQRERRATQLMEDLDRFRTIVEGDDALEIPEAVRALLNDPANEPASEDFPTFRGVSTIPGITSSDGTGEDLFFPKPFNQEQVQVVQRLAVRPAVVVQGPPGTGKTHTISNIISHYLATGKRVLITSQKSPALKVLRQQLPEAIRPLVISLLDSDRDGLKQFQQSVDTIAERLQNTNRNQVSEEIKALDHEIDAIHRKLATLDREVDEIGRRSIASISISGETVYPLDAAKELVSSQLDVALISDELTEAECFEPQFADEDIAALRKARKSLGQDLSYLGLTIPSQDHFPNLELLISIHRDLSRVETIQQQIENGVLVEFADQSEKSFKLAEDLVRDLKEVQQSRARLCSEGFGWTESLIAKTRSGKAMPALDALTAMESDISILAVEDQYFLTRPIELPDNWQSDEKLIAAVRKYASGESPLGFWTGLLGGALKNQLASIKLIGQAPDSASEWQVIERYIDYLGKSRKLKLSWNHAANHAELDMVPNEETSVGTRLAAQLNHLSALKDLVSLERSMDDRIQQLLPRWRGVPIKDDGPVGDLIDTIELNQTRERLSRARRSRDLLVNYLQGCQGEISHELMRCVINDLGNPSVADSQFSQTWTDLLQRLNSLLPKMGLLNSVSEVTKKIEASGAPNWARQLRSDPVIGQEDPLTPGNWRQVWRYRRLANWLSRVDQHGRLRELGLARGQQEQRLRKAYERSIELRTWLEMRRKATDSVQSALAAYADAVRRIGKGTGKRAGRYRREARLASDRAKAALPCWIMPHYRVSESLPAELGGFDLVIVDEASQSTLSALPAFLRAKQILIVGDDKQVSPDFVGRDQERAALLAKRYLTDQVEAYKSALTEEKSLYDLGKIAFAGGSLMLTEHFRSVAPIIEFSKAQFYGHQLSPLRLPTASERLDPPLIDILVEDGYRNGKTNPPEADCIVYEIAKIVADPSMAGRSIGVTTLLGQEQAALIYSKIENSIGTESMERHQIRVGDPTAFQGDERDIMFVSLVADKQDTPLVGKAYEQRFNVATSRARDRMVLVRSVELDDVRPSDQLRRALLEHFRVPFPSEGVLVKTRRDRCESEFEREVFDILAERGFLVDTQVRVGNFRIDLVVEGENDKRLAVELDGDRYHGPEQWSSDMMRQRILERAGWEVWRCFASRFYRERDEVVNELVELLRNRGISPIAQSQDWVSVYTEQRRWTSKDYSPAAEPMIPATASLVDELPKSGSNLSAPQYANRIKEPVARPVFEVREPSTDFIHQPRSTNVNATPPANLDLDRSASDRRPQPERQQNAGQRASIATSKESPKPTRNEISQAEPVSEDLIQLSILRLMSDGREWSLGDLKRKLSVTFNDSVRNMNTSVAIQQSWDALIYRILSGLQSNSLVKRGFVEINSARQHVITSRGVEFLKKSTTNSANKSSGTSRFSVDDARRALIELREQTIKPMFPDADPARGLLRKSMLDELLRKRPTSKEEFQRLISSEMRAETDIQQFQKHIMSVFEVIEKIEE
ncbi:MAG TPA: hypothetical protein DIU09_09275 [Hyphomonadaceae bacterium]|nr:hypothetical protein [Hyphomonadaceae bacterium]